MSQSSTAHSDTLPEGLDPARMPRHLAVIMDGNGRWARAKGHLRVFGHRSAVQAVRDMVEGCAELGIPYLTLYAFSTENWQRPRYEVEALMELLNSTVHKELPRLEKHRIRLNTIGEVTRLPKATVEALRKAIERTQHNTHLTLTLALSYGSRADILRAVQRIAEQVEAGHLSSKDIDSACFAQHLSTAGLPDPELLIRTSGEHRISNFLLWELAYTELYIAEKFWPDFRKADLYTALQDFQQRERRFGRTGEQLVQPTQPMPAEWESGLPPATEPPADSPTERTPSPLTWSSTSSSRG